MKKPASNDHPAVRSPAVAERFYPQSAPELRRLVTDFLGRVDVSGCVSPKAVIVPHAALIYSGPIASSAYARIGLDRAIVERVVIIGPSHHIAFEGVAMSGVRAFATPLGLVPVDTEAVRQMLWATPEVRIFDEAHAHEHSIEVQLPFLQMVLDHFKIIPLLTGQISDEALARIMKVLWGGPETRLVVSSDLSHFQSYSTAQRIDQFTSHAVEELLPQHISLEQACGHIPIRGLLCVARQRGMRAQTIDLRNSADTAGARDAVVGYGAFVFEENQTSQPATEVSAGNCLDAIRWD